MGLLYPDLGVQEPPEQAFRADIPARHAEILMLTLLDSIRQGAPASVQRTPSIAVVNASGSVAAGARKVTFIFSTDFAGTVMGVAFSGANDAALPIESDGGNTLAAIAYTITAGSARIVKIV